MDKQQQSLWCSIQDYQVGHADDVLPFVEKLARDNNWSQEFAQCCFDEYKKFVFLSQISEGPVSPSYCVDKVWHLHLTYTRDYWDRFCRDVLKAKLHHEPSKGGEVEHKKFLAMYDKTLQLYIDTFGEPPVNIWPGAETQIGVKSRRGNAWGRINTWCVSWFGHINHRTRILIATLCAPLLLIACSQQEGERDWFFYVKVAVVVYVVYKVIQWLNNHGGGGGRGGHGCSSCGGGGSCGGGD